MLAAWFRILGCIMQQGFSSRLKARFSRPWTSLDHASHVLWRLSVTVSVEMQFRAWMILSLFKPGMHLASCILNQRESHLQGMGPVFWLHRGNGISVLLARNPRSRYVAERLVHIDHFLRSILPDDCSDLGQSRLKDA